MRHLQQGAAGPVRRVPHEEQIAPCPGPHELYGCLLLAVEILSCPLLIFNVFHNLCCELLYATRFFSKHRTIHEVFSYYCIVHIGGSVCALIFIECTRAGHQFN